VCSHTPPTIAGSGLNSRFASACRTGIPNPQAAGLCRLCDHRDPPACWPVASHRPRHHFAGFAVACCSHHSTNPRISSFADDGSKSLTLAILRSISAATSMNARERAVVASVAQLQRQRHSPQPRHALYRSSISVRPQNPSGSRAGAAFRPLTLISEDTCPAAIPPRSDPPCRLCREHVSRRDAKVLLHGRLDPSPAVVMVRAIESKRTSPE
jgi:hypothetical protein